MENKSTSSIIHTADVILYFERLRWVQDVLNCKSRAVIGDCNWKNMITVKSMMIKVGMFVWL